MAGLFTYATMTKTLEEHKNKGKITHISILENVFEGQTLDMLAYQTLGFFFFIIKYRINCNKRNAFSPSNARETTGRLILG
jgi:hypothetical protein